MIGQYGILIGFISQRFQRVNVFINIYNSITIVFCFKQRYSFRLETAAKEGETKHERRIENGGKLVNFSNLRSLKVIC